MRHEFIYRCIECWRAIAAALLDGLDHFVQFCGFAFTRFVVAEGIPSLTAKDSEVVPRDARLGYSVSHFRESAPNIVVVSHHVLVILFLLETFKVQEIVVDG